MNKGVLSLVVLVLMSAPAWAQTQTINFEGIPAGTVVTEVFGDGGFGPISVDGRNGKCPKRGFDPNLEAAVIFDSSCPSGHCSGGDQDLGTPNETFGGPGRGIGGEAGMPFQNDTAQGNLLIVHQDCQDLADAAAGSGVVANPDDVSGASTITLEFPEPVTVFSYLILDKETNETQNVDFFDENDVLLFEFTSPATGDNGKAVVATDIGAAGEGTPGVKKIVFDRKGSRGLDDIVFLPDVCRDDAGPPEITFSSSFDSALVEALITITVTDDTGLTSIDVRKREENDPDGDPSENLIFQPDLSSNYDEVNGVTPGATSATLVYKVGDLFESTFVFVKATDLCGEVACPDNVAPTFIVEPRPGGGNIINVEDDIGIETLEIFFTSPTLTIDNIDFTPGSTTAQIEISGFGLFGALFADQCNAFVQDPELGASKRVSGGYPAEEASGSFALEQNYPNPFNPSTEIGFALSEAGEVRLAVYDLLGRQVAMLARGRYDAGRHTVRFDARDLASGTYLFRLDTAAGTAVRQMVLMK